jgi:hypothetical protein
MATSPCPEMKIFVFFDAEHIGSIGLTGGSLWQFK